MAKKPALLVAEVPASVKGETLDVVRAAALPKANEEPVLAALSGPTRVLPEGKFTPCAELTLLSYMGTGSEDWEPSVHAMAAMEFLMAAGDLIDDIEDDEAPFPHDRRSLGQLLETTSVLLMLCHSAFCRALDRGVPAQRVVRGLRALDSLGVDALNGQAADMALEAHPDASIEDSFDAAAQKSASLTRCAAELGASLGTDDQQRIGLFGRFGWHLGLFMQLTNDVAAVWPGAPDKSDLRLRKKTLPAVFALSLPLPASEHARLVRSYYGQSNGPTPSEDEVKWALWRCGAIHYTWMVAGTEKERAVRIARTLAAATVLGPDSPPR